MISLLLAAVLSQSAPDDSAPSAQVLGEQLEKESPGSRFGVVSLAAGSVSVGIATTIPDPLGPTRTRPVVNGVAASFGLGVRYSLKPRSDARVWMPAIAFVFGSAVDSKGFSPFLESRLELMSVSPGGLLQPNFVVYTTSGAGLTPLGSGRPVSLQPHVGAGIGWNWFPKGGGGGGGLGGGWGSLGGGGGAGLLIALPAALAITGLAFAGRVELRYTARPISGPGSDFFSVMLGFGS